MKVTRAMSVDSDTFPMISDDALEELISRIGTDFEAPEPYLTMASSDAVRHFADGIGDRNVRWREGGVAPPTILYAFDRVLSGYVGGLPGVHAMFAGTDFNWHRPIRHGERLRSRPVP